jgi:hypothetical protein
VPAVEGVFETCDKFEMTRRRLSRLPGVLRIRPSRFGLCGARPGRHEVKPADPDTGESTVQERMLGLLPNPFERHGVKFAVTYIGEVLGNPTAGLKQGFVYEDRSCGAR